VRELLRTDLAGKVALLATQGEFELLAKLGLLNEEFNVTWVETQCEKWLQTRREPEVTEGGFVVWLRRLLLGW